MPSAKIDPIETFYAVGSTLIGRIFLFFSAGWVGLVLGRFAAAFNEWSDFLKPRRAFEEMISGWGFGLAGELLTFIFSPIAIFSLARSPILFVGGLLVIGAAFVVMVFTEERAPVWWLLVAATISICPVFGESGSFTWPTGAVLAFFWSGIGCAAWWALRAYHPGLVEKTTDIFRGKDGAAEALPARSRKVPEDTWGEPVKGWGDGESGDEDEEED